MGSRVCGTTGLTETCLEEGESDAGHIVERSLADRIRSMLCSPDDAGRIDAISEELNCTRTLNRAFEPILNAVLSALDSSSVTFRTKALKALGHVVTSDATVLTHVSTRSSNILCVDQARSVPG